MIIIIFSLRLLIWNWSNMMHIITLILAVSVHQISCKLYPIEVKYPLLGTPAPPGSPWPMPKLMNSTSSSLYFLDENNFKITSNMKVACDIIEENRRIYTTILFPPKSKFNSLPLNSNFLYELNVEVSFGIY